MNRKKNFPFKIGDIVQSTYRARWIGVILRHSGIDGCYIVRPEFTKDGRPQRKPKERLLHGDWLKLYVKMES